MATISLKVPPNNLYSTGFIVDMGDDLFILKRDKVTYERSNTGDYIHIIKENDTIWTLAYDYLGDSKKWFIIADINPEIENPLELPIGLKIIIPNLDLVSFK